MESAFDFARPAGPPSRGLSWPGGRFEWGERPATEQVESRIEAQAPMLMVTLQGGARRVRQTTEDGLRYDGPDAAGSFTYLPAGCARDLKIEAVAWRWAIFTFSADGPPPVDRSLHARADPFLRELLGGMRDAAEEAGPEPALLETAGMLAGHHLKRRYIGSPAKPAAPLNRSQMGRLDDFVAAHLREPLRIADLAGLLDMSPGHFHRRFAATTGTTPLQWIARQRIEAARALLSDRALSVLEVSLAVGIASPSRFARQFRQVAGMSPRAYRRAFVDR